MMHDAGAGAAAAPAPARAATAPRAAAALPDPLAVAVLTAGEGVLRCRLDAKGFTCCLGVPGDRFQSGHRRSTPIAAYDL